MAKDLTVSGVERQNILNNPYALEEIEKATRITRIPFEGKNVLLKEQVALFFDITIWTIENYISDSEEELKFSGYEVLRGKRLQDIKLAISALDDTEIDFGIIKKTARLVVFDFCSFLHLSMLITEGEKARLLRQTILDIVIDTITRKTSRKKLGVLDEEIDELLEDTLIRKSSR